MTELQRLFFQRMDLPPIDPVTFDDLSTIQQAMGRHVPFENMDIAERKIREVSRKNLQDKILGRCRGGLCYELNPLFYYFLQDSGFDVHLVSGTVYKRDTESWTSDNGHISNLLTHNGMPYIVDVGFGSFLPMAPVPFGGEVVQSPAGDFRVRERPTEKGTHVLEMRQTYEFLDGGTSPEWHIGYAFRLDAIDEVRVNKTQVMITEDEGSPFRNGPILVKITDNGHISMTSDTFSTTINGQKEKQSISPEQFKELLENQFGLEQR